MNLDILARVAKYGRVYTLTADLQNEQDLQVLATFTILNSLNISIISVLAKQIKCLVR